MDTTDNNINTLGHNALEAVKADFSDIAPYDDSQYHEKISSMVAEPAFEHAVRYIMPDVDYPALCNMLTGLDGVRTFQTKVMAGVIEGIIANSTDGVTVSGLENVSADQSYTYISNHRDIVLDASLLNYCLLRNNLPLCQVAIGNNLLIMPWIEDLVRINGSFIVKRDVKRLEALRAAQHLSNYIHFAVANGHSVWIAQREGRAKDSNDRTQPSLIKMLAIGGGDDVRDSLAKLNLLPVSISYEFDPNDYLKVREFAMKRLDPDFKKSQRDDLLSMETGLLKYKGRVHFHLCKGVTGQILEAGNDKAALINATCTAVDAEIHANYKFYPVNYIAYDRLENTERFAAEYSAEDIAKFDAYMSEQLAKVDIPGLDAEQQRQMQIDFLTMYANPLRNHLAGK